MSSNNTSNSANSSGRLQRLTAALDYEFRSADLLVTALTHRSVGPDNNERLEFLGDAVLGQAIALQLYQALGAAPESLMSQRRSALVRKDCLAEIARELQLGDYLELGGSERKAGVGARDSVLADALEAVLGAVFLDGGSSAAAALVERLFASRLARLDHLEIKDPKTRLQEAMQARGWSLPEYRVVDTEGALHEQTFAVECRLNDAQLAGAVSSADRSGPAEAPATIGVGASRRDAEKAAAESMLGQLAESGTIGASD